MDYSWMQILSMGLMGGVLGYCLARVIFLDRLAKDLAINNDIILKSLRLMCEGGKEHHKHIELLLFKSDQQIEDSRLICSKIKALQSEVERLDKRIYMNIKDTEG